MFLAPKTPSALRRLLASSLALAAPLCHAASGTWLPDAGGNWSAPANWTSGTVASGADATANFTNDLTAPRTVTLDAPVTIGKLVFADSAPGTAAEWTLAGNFPLTLATLSGTPEITTTGEMTHLAAPLGGAAFTKKGPGTLELSGANTFTTPTLSFAIGDSGILRLAASGALGGISTVAMPGTNTSVSRIDLAGNVTLAANLTTAGRSASAFLRNVSGDNAWNGSITISGTGGNYAIESQTGTLTVGAIQNGIANTRALSLTGAGDGTVAGIIFNGTGGALSLTKNGAGTWKFSAANTYSGTTDVTTGTLQIATGGRFGPGAISNAALIEFASANDTIVLNAISGSGAARISGSGKLTLAGNSSYTGGTTTNGVGSLSVAHDNAFGTGKITLGDTVGSGQIWFQPAGDRTLANDFEIRTQRWIIDGNAINGNAPGTLTVTGAVYFNQAGAKDIYLNRPLVLAGPVTSTGGFTKLGGFPLTLAGSANYAGETSLTSGVTTVTGTLTSGKLTLASRATLTGGGTISNAVTISSGGLLIPGNDSSATLTTGALTLSSGSILRLSFGAPGDPANTRLAITGNFSRNGTLSILSKPGLTDGLYTIATYTGSLTGSGFQTIDAPAGYVASFFITTPGELKLRLLAAGNPSPANNIMLSMASSLDLTWSPPSGVLSYDVYLGTSSTAVANATTATSGIYRGQTTATNYTASGFTNGATNYWRIDYHLSDGSTFKGPLWNFTLVQENDLMPDTWAATDALNRVLPDAALAGPPRDDRQIAIFYFLWHTPGALGNDGPRDNTKEIDRLGGYTDKKNPWSDNPLWMTGGNGRSWYWGEPENGYYASDDEWVIRRHISLLTAAGVDILALDNTNGHPEIYQAAYTKIAETIRKMRKEGMKIDLKFLFVTHGGSGGSPATVKWLYENFYKPGLYPEMWLMWDGKPAITGYPDGLDSGDIPMSQELRDFFTIRSSWANVASLQNEWQWIDSTTPQNWGYSTRADIPEQVPVAAGGWCNGNLGRSYMNRSQPAYDNFHLTPARTEGLGKFYDEQGFYGRKLDPRLIFITGWNEWWAGAWTAPSAGGGYNILDNACSTGQRYFVDNYNAEYSRDIEPMKGGFSDNYYFQMVAQNRLRKGVRTVPYASPPKTVSSLADFTDVRPTYYDAPDETLPRNAPGTFSNLPNYTNTTGRNDFRVLKVARDATNLYFFAETKTNITAPSGGNWMMLFLDIDQSRTTGWEGYDYALNLGGSGQVRKFNDNTWSPTAAGSATVAVSGKQIMITVPRATVGLTADPLKFDFKWADNVLTNGDIAEFSTGGDAAPERRFNYRFQAAPIETVTLRHDGFETGDDSAAGLSSSWGETFNPGTQWTIKTTTPYTGARCLVGTGTTTTTDAGGTLINRTSTAGLDSVRVAFRYKLANVQDAQNIQIYYRNRSNQWVPVKEIGRDQYHTSSQAWGYNERQNVWLYYSDARLNSGADSQFFHSDFAVHIQIKDLHATNQIVAIDDFQITGTRPVAAPTAATAPTPADGASDLAADPPLSWTPGTGGDAQDIYFGTSGNITKLATINGSTNSQALLSPLTPGTTAAWRVDTTNSAGTTTGTVWTFTTIVPNRPPVLAAISNQQIVAGQTLSLTAAATDPDLPAQTLNYSLKNSPANASIDPATGRIGWRPLQIQAPGTYPITVMVSDNATPALTAEITFQVQVSPSALPQMAAPTRLPNGTFQFTISGDTGPDYRIWATEDLKTWLLLETLVSPALPHLYQDLTAIGKPAKFYRLQMAP